MALLHAVKIINFQQCLQLRKDVLWPKKPLESCILENDDQGNHFGIFIESELVSCLSIFQIDGLTYRIRKFATAREFQGQGLGSLLLEHAIEFAKAKNAEKIILRARVTAVPFYSRFGFQGECALIQQDGVSFIEMHRLL